MSTGVALTCVLLVHVAVQILNVVPMCKHCDITLSVALGSHIFSIYARKTYTNVLQHNSGKFAHRSRDTWMHRQADACASRISHS